MIVLAALLAAGSPILQQHDAYVSCVTAQTVRLGASNTEAADTILRAVRSICLPQWVAMEQTWPTGTGVPYADRMRDDLFVRWRSNAEDAAVAALLEARAKRP